MLLQCKIQVRTVSGSKKNMGLQPEAVLRERCRIKRKARGLGLQG